MKVNNTRWRPIQISCVKCFYSLGRMKSQENYDNVDKEHWKGWGHSPQDSPVLSAEEGRQLRSHG